MLAHNHQSDPGGGSCKADERFIFVGNPSFNYRWLSVKTLHIVHIDEFTVAGQAHVPGCGRRTN